MTRKPSLNVLGGELAGAYRAEDRDELSAAIQLAAAEPVECAWVSSKPGGAAAGR